jgi:hypothetical protein
VFQNVSKVPSLKRENVPETNFMFNHRKWSPWKLAITPSAPAATDKKWVKRRGDGNGYRRKSLFTTNTNKAATYEFAVQTRQGAKKFVVYTNTHNGFLVPTSWESRLLRQSHVRAQIEAVIHKNCNVFSRRVLLNTRCRLDTASGLSQKYDYAWKSLGKVRPGQRSVMKTKVQISDDKL